jgi:hypothetical protein
MSGWFPVPSSLTCRLISAGTLSPVKSLEAGQVRQSIAVMTRRSVQ